MVSSTKDGIVRRKPELVSPAGNWECVRAAVACGADAVYFGLKDGFNARMRADNFSLCELKTLMDYLHQRGVRGYLALNTLVFTDELPLAVRILKMAEESGVDAVIVQDIGLCLLAKRFAPSVALHTSTQMTVTSPEGVEVVRELGIQQVVLARELSIRELRRFGGCGVPLEVFVHGALCVAYSGQCLTSEALGRRSANRGECAQACRLPYRLWVDGEIKDLGERRYLLSPQDLAAIDYIPELIAAGISSFKIEGRLKTPEYVAAITGAYRSAIDEAWKSIEAQVVECDRRSKNGTKVNYEMEMMFSRGLYSGWLEGVNHQKLVHGLYSNKRGAFVGEIAEVKGNGVRLVGVKVSLRRGDGVLFDNGGDQSDLLGGRVYQVRGDWLFFERGLINQAKIKAGDKVFKTDDPQLRREIRQRFAKDKEILKVFIKANWKCSAGKPAELIFSVTGGSDQWEVRVVSDTIVVAARNVYLTSECVEAHVARLGETCFALERFDCQIEGKVFLPLSEINRMRRKAVELLYQIMPCEGWIQWVYERRKEKALYFVNENNLSDRTVKVIKQIDFIGVCGFEPYGDGSHLTWSVLCRTEEQAEVAVECGWKRIYLDFEDIRRYQGAVEKLKALANGDAEIYLATPRIQKSGEIGFFNVIHAANPDGVLIRNLGGLFFFTPKSKTHGLKCIGDFSLNVANPWSARWFMEWGLEAVTVSYDLTWDQIIRLAEAMGGRGLEVTLHQHMPMFHMEHCVFAAFLSKGTDHTNCGRPCECYRVELEDRVGLRHPVIADVGCRNTVFHARSQSGAAYFSVFKQAGIRNFRIELLNESRAEALRLLRSYEALHRGGKTAECLIRELSAINGVGVVRGTFEDREFSR
ncbi:MAG: U32 family peptidase [Methylacidiphilales bacterium]|nr:U32 family peptidase [Candidatus Methylacidiphilales bacterium]MDW8348994.1 DUF3656 domain-containing protein [Verrucomicrobiae bacterium]